MSAFLLATSWLPAFPSPELSPPLELLPPELSPLEPDFALLLREDDDDVDRSFLAQPDPLKWTAGVENPLRIVPSTPQFGQKRGPASLIP